MFKIKKVLMELAIIAIAGVSFSSTFNFPKDACAQTNGGGGTVVGWGNQVYSYVEPGDLPPENWTT